MASPNDKADDIHDTSPPEAPEAAARLIQPSFPLLKLPAELRNQIYQFHLEDFYLKLPSSVHLIPERSHKNPRKSLKLPCWLLYLNEFMV